jgi:predicted metalloenzyme YecM
MIVDDYRKFLDEFFEKFDQLQVDASTYLMDHIAYQASSAEDYDRVVNELSQLGKMTREARVEKRRVGIFKLSTPLVYKHYTIPALEVVEPKQGKIHQSGFHHAEFVIDEDLQSFANRYPVVAWDLNAISRAEFPKVQLEFQGGLGVKFHTTPVLEEN